MDAPFYVLSSADETTVRPIFSIYHFYLTDAQRTKTVPPTPANRVYRTMLLERVTTSKILELLLKILMMLPKTPFQIVAALDTSPYMCAS